MSGSRLKTPVLGVESSTGKPDLRRLWFGLDLGPHKSAEVFLLTRYQE